MRVISAVVRYACFRALIFSSYGLSFPLLCRCYRFRPYLNFTARMPEDYGYKCATNMQQQQSWLSLLRSGMREIPGSPFVGCRTELLCLGAFRKLDSTFRQQADAVSVGFVPYKQGPFQWYHLFYPFVILCPIFDRYCIRRVETTERLWRLKKML